MKGVIFAELIHWVEEALSSAVADAVIVRSQVASNGVYTSVGNYPHEEALAMIGALAELTERPVPELASSYGYWRSSRFVEPYPEMFEGYTDAVSGVATGTGGMSGSSIGILNASSGRAKDFHFDNAIYSSVPRISL